MKQTFLIGLVAVVMLLTQGDIAKKGSFDITEADGQEDELSLAGGKEPEVPVITGKKGSFDTPSGQDPEFPVTPNKKGSFDITELEGKGNE